MIANKEKIMRKGDLQRLPQHKQSLIQRFLESTADADNPPEDISLWEMIENIGDQESPSSKKSYGSNTTLSPKVSTAQGGPLSCSSTDEKAYFPHVVKKKNDSAQGGPPSCSSTDEKASYSHMVKKKNDSGEPKKISILERMLKDVAHPILGLDYMVEFFDKHDPFKPRLFKCALCRIELTQYNVILHLRGRTHKMKYMKRHFEEDYKFLESNPKFKSDAYLTTWAFKKLFRLGKGVPIVTSLSIPSIERMKISTGSKGCMTDLTLVSQQDPVVKEDKGTLTNETVPKLPPFLQALLAYLPEVGEHSASSLKEVQKDSSMKPDLVAKEDDLTYAMRLIDLLTEACLKYHFQPFPASLKKASLQIFKQSHNHYISSQIRKVKDFYNYTIMNNSCSTIPPHPDPIQNEEVTSSLNASAIFFSPPKEKKRKRTSRVKNAGSAVDPYECLSDDPEKDDICILYEVPLKKLSKDSIESPKSKFFASSSNPTKSHSSAAKLNENIIDIIDLNSVKEEDFSPQKLRESIISSPKCKDNFDSKLKAQFSVCKVEENVPHRVTFSSSHFSLEGMEIDNSQDKGTGIFINSFKPCNNQSTVEAQLESVFHPRPFFEPNPF